MHLDMHDEFSSDNYLRLFDNTVEMSRRTFQLEKYYTFAVFFQKLLLRHRSKGAAIN